MIARNQGLTDEKIFALQEYFLQWITGDPTTIIPDQNLLMKGAKYWEILHSNPHHKAFAHFALPLLAIPASEAIVERAFWYQRRLLGDHSTRMSIAVEQARMNFAMIQRKK
jgi:hypothetical protein